MNHPKQGQAGRVRDARAAAHRPDDGEAFLPDPTTRDRHNALADSDAESFAEEFIASATAGEPVVTEAEDEVIEEEWGGPFLELDTNEPSAEVSEPTAEPAPGAKPAQPPEREPRRAERPPHKPHSRP
jgi:hypothetical protein